MSALNDALVDPLVRDWAEASHKDDWQVPVVYETTFRKLVANELERLIADPASYTASGEFRPTVLVKRIAELRGESR